MADHARAGGYSGACQCGAVRLALNVRRLVVYACHGADCQKQSASAFALSAPAARAALTVAGRTRSWSRPTHSGARTVCHFCPRCGSRLYHVSDAAPQTVTVKAGALDDLGALEPIAHLWTRRKQAWIIVDANVETFDTQPDDLPAWRAARLCS